MLKEHLPAAPGIILELGSGGGFLKEIIPQAKTSEVVPIPAIDLVCDACSDLPFKDGELRAILLVDVLHHLPDTPAFFKIASDKLRSGGRIIMIEPWNSTWSRLIYQHLHHEPFDPAAQSWSFPSEGPLSSANGALPWIIFRRDRERFTELFPQFCILKCQGLMPISYLLSGGVSLRAMAPGWLYQTVRMTEKLTGMERLCPMFTLLVIEKGGTPAPNDCF